MSIEHPPHDKQVRVNPFQYARHRDNVVPLRGAAGVHQAPLRGDALLAALSPLLDEADGLRGEKPRRQDTANVVLLLEENARLRKLAVKLSNLLGDLPTQGETVRT